MKRWMLAQCDPALVQHLSDELTIPPALASVLVRQGLTTSSAAAHFLNPRLSDLSDPFELPDMRPAIDRILLALNQREQIVIYGDYDVDGITSSALLRQVLKAAGACVDNFLPHRMDEGYGLSVEAIARCIEVHQPSLIISVDCGTTSVNEVALLGEQGIDIIIIDHHEPSEMIPSCVALVNPLQSQHEESVASFSTAGLVFKVAHALVKAARARGDQWAQLLDLREHLDLVALGTIADLVPLTGENRILARSGLKCLGQTAKLGLRALQDVAGVSSPVRPHDVGFRLGPRLNAAGRLDDAMTSLKLLLADDVEDAQQLAQSLDDHNAKRQRLQERMVEEALADAAQQIEQQSALVLVLAREGWHPGIVGIVASRVTQEFYRPSIAIALGDEQAKGSCRSISGFSMVDALDACHEVLVGHGGHEMAAGLSIVPSQLEALRIQVNQYAQKVLTDEMLLPCLAVTAELALTDLDYRFICEMERFQPFGMGNPRPVFLLQGLFLAGRPRIVGKCHLKFALTDGQHTVDAIWWGAGGLTLPGGSFDVAAQVELNRFRGAETIQLNVQDIRSRS